MLHKPMLNRDSSPFQSSPFNASEGNSSPRLFWQGRTTPTQFKSENGPFSPREGSPSPTRRSSIEKLQRASRVKNSNMFAREQKHEYDPTQTPVIERPLAKQVQGNAYGGLGIQGLRAEERKPGLDHHRSESESTFPSTPVLSRSPAKLDFQDLSRTPSRDQVSPTKSSLSSSRFNGKASFDHESGTWSEDNDNSIAERQLPDGRVLHRHAKSVTFDAAPPQVNEYEMATPDVSSIGTIGSRENSYDDEEDEDDDEDDMYRHEDDMEQDESFDATLEDAPVVGPDDWRHSTPDNSSDLYDPFVETYGEGPEGSPLPEAGPSSPQVQRAMSRNASTRQDSVDSNGSSRPLPPLPGFMQNRDRSGSASSNGLGRMNSPPRSLPSPLATSSYDSQSKFGGQLPLDERLKLMMIQDEEKPAKSEAELQRERRLRRGSPFTRRGSNHATEAEASQMSAGEEDDTLGDIQLGDYNLPPRISRESILRKVKGQNEYEQDDSYNFSSPPGSPAHRATLDPDIPIPSTEQDYDEYDDDDTGSVIIKPEPEDDEQDLYSISERYQPDSRQDNQYQDSDQEEASPRLQSNNAIEDDGPPTPRARTPPPPPLEAPFEDPIKQDKRVSLPDFQGFLGNSKDFGLGMESYMTPSPPPIAEKEIVDPVEADRVEREATLESEDSDSHFEERASAQPDFIEPEFLKSASVRLEQAQSQREESEVSSLESEHRPRTPEQPKYNPRPEYDGTGWGSDDEEYEVGTPDSVIRHPQSPLALPARESPSIPEQVATIKSSAGSKLKTRPSATPADLMAMRDQRRQVSNQRPLIPPIPERSNNRLSFNGERETESDGEVMERKSSFAKRSLTLDIGNENDLSLSLDKDFDRLIEAQKVAFAQSSYTQDPGLISESNDLSTYEIKANITPRKQRGYLMRQNTKVVVASSDNDHSDHFRATRSAGNSPIKANRPQSWTVEPWNGRKKSLRDSSVSRKNKILNGPVPPLPGQESNVAGLGSLAEETIDVSLEEPGDRGRLFVKVIGVKELDLPLPKSKSCSSSHATL